MNVQKDQGWERDLDDPVIEVMAKFFVKATRPLEDLSSGHVKNNPQKAGHGIKILILVEDGSQFSFPHQRALENPRP